LFFVVFPVRSTFSFIIAIVMLARHTVIWKTVNSNYTAHRLPVFLPIRTPLYQPSFRRFVFPAILITKDFGFSFSADLKKRMLLKGFRFLSDLAEAIKMQRLLANRYIIFASF
jgi:hypothetical protein